MRTIVAITFAIFALVACDDDDAAIDATTADATALDAAPADVDAMAEVDAVDAAAEVDAGVVDGVGVDAQ